MGFIQIHFLEKNRTNLFCPCTIIYFICTLVSLQSVASYVAKPASQSRHPRQDRTAKLIHYAIVDSASTLRVDPQSTLASQGRGTNRVQDSKAQPWLSEVSELRCADNGGTSWGWILCTPIISGAKGIAPSALDFFLRVVSLAY